MEGSTSLDNRRQESIGRPGTALLVANYAPDVGFAWWLMEHFWIELAGLARARGLEPLLLYPEAGPIPDSIREAAIETRFQPFPGPGIPGLVRLLGLVRSRAIRVIYMTDRPFTRWWYLALRLAGVRSIINHDHTPGDRPPSRGPKGLAKAVFRRIRPICCDLQICVSPFIRERAISNARIPASKTVVVQNGIAPVECGGDPEYAKRVFGLPDSHRICVTVGRASPYKRIDFVIEVAGRYVRTAERDDLIFLFCGEGPEMDRLRALAEERGLEGHFVFAGRRTDVREILCSADLALHAARGEAFSLAILEYMSAGLAVLVPDTPSVSQAIRHGETGLIYPSDQVDGVVGLLRELTADPGRIEALGNAAKEEVGRRYSHDLMTDRFRSVLAGALDRL